MGTTWIILYKAIQYKKLQKLKLLSEMMPAKGLHPIIRMS